MFQSKMSVLSCSFTHERVSETRQMAQFKVLVELKPNDTLGHLYVTRGHEEYAATWHALSKLHYITLIPLQVDMTGHTTASAMGDMANVPYAYKQMWEELILEAWQKAKQAAAIPDNEPLVLSLRGTADQMRVWLNLVEEQEVLIRDIMKAEPKADLEDIQIWFMSAEEHGQPHTVEEFVEWFKLDDEGNPK
jgi:hypothetical protein